LLCLVDHGLAVEIANQKMHGATHLGWVAEETRLPGPDVYLGKGERLPGERLHDRDQAVRRLIIDPQMPLAMERNYLCLTQP
jgi:hypothetical protein